MKGEGMSKGKTDKAGLKTQEASEAQDAEKPRKPPKPKTQVTLSESGGERDIHRLHTYFAFTP